MCEAQPSDPRATETEKQPDEQKQNLSNLSDENTACTLEHGELRALLNFCYGDHELPMMKECGVWAVRNVATSEVNRARIREVMEGKGAQVESAKSEVPSECSSASPAAGA